MKWLLKAAKISLLFTLVFLILHIRYLPVSELAKACLVVLIIILFPLGDWLLIRHFPQLAPDKKWISFQTGSVVPAEGRAWYAGLVELVSGLGQFTIIIVVMLFAMLFIMTTGNNIILLYYGIPLVLAMLALDAIGILAMPLCRHCGKRLESRVMPKGLEIWNVCYACKIRESSGTYAGGD